MPPEDTVNTTLTIIVRMDVLVVTELIMSINYFFTRSKRYTPKPEIVDLFKGLIAEELNDQTNNFQDDSKQLRSQIKELQEKIVYTREPLSSKQIKPADFREMKSEYSAKLERLETKLKANNDDQEDI